MKLRQRDHRARVEALASRIEHDLALDVLPARALTRISMPLTASSSAIALLATWPNTAERLRLGRDDREPDVERELAGAGAAIRASSYTGNGQLPVGGTRKAIRPDSSAAASRSSASMSIGSPEVRRVSAWPERGPWFRANADDRDVELDADAVVKIGRVASGIDVPQAACGRTAPPLSAISDARSGLIAGSDENSAWTIIGL